MSRSEKLQKLIHRALHEKDADMWSMGDIELEKRPLSDSEHPGQTAVLLVREAMGQFELPSQPQLHYQGMRRSSGHGQHHLRDGVITVQATFNSLSGHKNHIEVPVVVHGGYMVFPEVFVDQQGQPQVMAQSSFDDILRRGNVHERQQDRKNLYSPHAEPVIFNEQPSVGKGMFGVQAQAAPMSFEEWKASEWPPEAIREHAEDFLEDMRSDHEMFAEDFWRYVSMESNRSIRDFEDYVKYFEEVRLLEFYNEEVLGKTAVMDRSPSQEEMTQLRREQREQGEERRLRSPMTQVRDINAWLEENGPNNVYALRRAFPNEDLRYLLRMSRHPELADHPVFVQAAPPGSLSFADGDAGQLAITQGGPGALSRQADHSPHGLDPAERARHDWPKPGEETTLADEIQVRIRGGSRIIYSAGTKVKIIRDMAGDGYLYYCEFPDGRRAPVRYDNIR